jgi:hypothetical protein
MVCQECHRAKVKCNSHTPCERCIRLGKNCVPRVSQQGKRPSSSQHDLKSTKSKKVRIRSDNNSDTCGPSNGSGEAIIAQSDISSYGSQHLGINWLIRSWIGIAFRRRSFALLGRASSLANKCNISMDQILCGKSFPFPNLDERSHNSLSSSKPMTFLESIVCKENSTPLTTPVEPGRLNWNMLPNRLKNKIYNYILSCRLKSHVSSSSSLNTIETCVDSALIFAIQKVDGCINHYVSRKFEEEVISLSNIQAVYKANQREVISLFLSKSDCTDFHRAVAKQLSLILNLDSDPPLSTTNTLLNIGTGKSVCRVL